MTTNLEEEQVGSQPASQAGNGGFHIHKILPTDPVLTLSYRVIHTLSSLQN